jgi:hypothetical protein
VKILVVGTPEYDFCAATLIEGLRCLQETYDLEVVCSERSNYATVEGKWHTSLTDFYKTEQDCSDFGDDADIVIITSNKGVKEHLVKPKWVNKTVYIDGEDLPDYRKSPKEYMLYFKREMLRDRKHKNNVLPFPFAAERRYFRFPDKEFNEIWERKNKDVTCMFGPHDSTKPWRTTIEEALKRMELENSFIGQSYGGGSHANTKLDTGGREHYNYFQALADTRISIDGYGAYGCNAARFWESLANGCFLFTQKIRIFLPDRFIIDGALEEFLDEDDMVSRLGWLLNEGRPRLQKVARNGYLALKEHHTTEVRAKYLITECQNKEIIKKKLFTKQ